MTERIADNSRIQQESGARDEEYSRLLSLFHPDPERAQKEYELQYSRLMKMFEYRGHVQAEDLVTKTFRIVSRELVNERVSVFAVRVAQKLLKELSQEDFSRLLARLDQDQMEAGVKYEALRNKLMRFFRSKNCGSAGELADKSLDLLARKLATKNIENLIGYAFGIGRKVFLEWIEVPEELSIDENVAEPVNVRGPHQSVEITSISDEEEKRMAALEQCLDKLDKDDRDLILAFYNTTPKTKVFLRKRLAHQTRITKNALGVRAFRIRKLLETCVNQQTEHP